MYLVVFNAEFMGTYYCFDCTSVSALSFESVVIILLFEEMRRADFASVTDDALFVREMKSELSKSRFDDRNKSRGRFKSRDQLIIKC